MRVGNLCVARSSDRRSCERRAAHKLHACVRPGLFRGTFSWRVLCGADSAFSMRPLALLSRGCSCGLESAYLFRPSPFSSIFFRCFSHRARAALRRASLRSSGLTFRHRAAPSPTACLFIGDRARAGLSTRSTRSSRSSTSTSTEATSIECTASPCPRGFGHNNEKVAKSKYVVPCFHAVVALLEAESGALFYRP